MRGSLADINGVTIRDKGKEKCGIVTFSMKGGDPAEFQQGMRKHNIHVGISNFQNAPLDMEDWGLQSMTRCPVHYYNTEEEIEFFVKRVREFAS